MRSPTVTKHTPLERGGMAQVAIRLHSSPESFIFEPLGQSLSADWLEIDRVSGRFTRRPSAYLLVNLAVRDSPSLLAGIARPSYDPKEVTEDIYGIFGIIRLHAGTYPSSFDARSIEPLRKDPISSSSPSGREWAVLQDQMSGA